MRRMPRVSVPVYLEEGSKRTFAVTVDWPGWARAGRGADEALETLAAYADRYAVVPRKASIPFAKARSVSDLSVRDRVRGSRHPRPQGGPGSVAAVRRRAGLMPTAG